MRLLSLGVLLGALSLFVWSDIPTLSWGWFVVIVSLLMGAWRWRFALGIALGALLVIHSSNTTIHSLLPEETHGIDIIVYGKITSIPDKKTKGWRFKLYVTSAYIKNKKTAHQTPFPLTGLVQLSAYSDALSFKPDETWQLTVRLKPPSGFMNPGGADYEKYLFSQRIKATGYIRNDVNNKRLSEASPYAINTLRATISRFIHSTVNNPESAAIISALAVAERASMTQEQWRVLRKTGTHHLMAISGLHIGIVTGLGLLPALLLGWLWPAIYLKVPYRIFGGLLGAVLAVSYTALAGFTLPTQRALIMVLVLLVGIVSRRNIDALTLLSIALFSILVVDPLAILSQGFWLSFMAVGIIFYWLARRIKQERYSLITMQLALSFGMLPIVLLFFNEASLISPLANLIAIPWVAIIVVPSVLISMLLMLVSTDLAVLGLQFVDWQVHELMLLLTVLADLLPSYYATELPLAIVIAALFGIFVLCLPAGFPARWLGLVLCIPLFAYEPAKPELGSFDFHLLDVGQGQASVIQTQNHSLVYDTGPKSGDFDTGALVVLPFLRAKSIKQLDMMMISHEDIDHRGGAQAIIEGLPVKQVLSSDTTLNLSKQGKPVAIEHCDQGKTWHWDGVDFEILHPSRDWRGNDNNRSCILKVSTAHKQLLLTGDAQRKAEHALLNIDRDKVKADVLLVGHHGSKTSTSPAFLAAVDPKTALISAGFRNRFRFPVKQVTDRLEASSVDYFNTADTGAIQAHFPADDSAISYQFYRLQHQRFWHRKPSALAAQTTSQ